MINQRFAPIEIHDSRIMRVRRPRPSSHNPFVFMVLAAALVLSVAQTGCTGVTGANSPDPTTATTMSVGGATGSFGSVASGSSGTQTFTVTNTGTALLTITQVAVTGAGYSVSGITPPLTIAAGQVTTFSVKFAPSTAGVVSGAVSITANTNPAVSTINLSGTGTGGAQPVMSVSPSSINFGTAGIGVTLG